MNEESGAVRDASELERKVSEAAFIIASKNQTAMARTGRKAGRHRHTYLHTSHQIDRAPSCLDRWLVSCTAGFQAGSTLAHIYIKPLSAYGRTIGRPVGL